MCNVGPDVDPDSNIRLINHVFLGVGCTQTLAGGAIPCESIQACALERPLGVRAR